MGQGGAGWTICFIPACSGTGHSMGDGGKRAVAALAALCWAEREQPAALHWHPSPPSPPSQFAGPRFGVQGLSHGLTPSPAPPTRHPSPAASSTESSLAKMPPILLKAGSCSPYFSSSCFMWLISSSGAEQRQRCSAPATGAGAASRAPTPLPDQEGCRKPPHWGEHPLRQLWQNASKAFPSCHGTPEHWWQTPLGSSQPNSPYTEPYL